MRICFRWRAVVFYTHSGHWPGPMPYKEGNIFCLGQVAKMSEHNALQHRSTVYHVMTRVLSC